MIRLPALLFFSAFATVHSLAADWPMWRCDAGRTAVSDEQLPEKLQLQWEHKYPAREQVWDDPLNHDLMTYDKGFEPVALGDKVFIGFNDCDKVVALDLASGREVWAFYTDGPVRLPPAAWEGKIYVTSDDGHLYCLDAADGKVVWSFRGAPAARKVLGNGRVISAWPARGGVVIHDGRVYFSASIWPFMGTFIYALDAVTGKVVWVNDGTGADFIKQPHSAGAFAGVAPQGAFVVAGETLLVPGGRSVPAGLDLATGALKYFHLSAGGKGNGGSFVAAIDKAFYVHTRERGVRRYDLKSGLPGKFTTSEPVLTGDRIYAAAVSEEDVAVVRGLDAADKVLWELEADASGDLIKAGAQLYAAGKDSLCVIALPTEEGKAARVKWTMPVKGDVQRLLAANGKLIAVTLDGRLLAYGAGKPTRAIASKPAPLPKPAATALATARTLLAKLDDTGGYGLVFGADDLDLLDALLAESKLRLTVIDPDAEKVARLRLRYDAAGLYGSRITFHIGDPLTFQAPPFIAHLIVIGRSALPAMQTPGMMQVAYALLRPYGGLMHWPAGSAELTAAIESASLEKAVVQPGKAETLVVREGALPGAADWTHQYGDIGNTVKSDDTRVRAPLGVLWFGGTSNLDVLPRHGHGPPEQVVNGRLFIEGMNSLSARDVYTGRVLWKHDFGDLGTFGIYYNETYAETPLSIAYNQKHIPGANGRGSNYASTADSIYVAVQGRCHVLDARTGKLRRRIALRNDEEDTAKWAFIGVYGDLLIAGDDFAHYSLRLGSAPTKSSIDDYSASAGLAVFDRHDGRLLWRVKARHSFLHNAIVAGEGRIYCLDKLTTQAEGLLDRRGAALPKDFRLVALDARTGEVAWEQEENVFGTWLGYSAQHDILLQAGSKASDRLASEAGAGMVASRGKDGEVLWADLKRSYTGPCILHHEVIFTGANSYSNSGGAFNLLTGQPYLITNPLTQQLEPWRLNRTYGCNTIIASEHLLTFRSGAAGYYDLETMSGTGNLGGFKSGCTSNLVAANGVLNAPDYTRTCSCAYQNQTSLALIHMPEMEMWTYSQFGFDAQQGDRVLRAGINFGAPGNRRAPDGTLWLEYPPVSTGNAPLLGVEGMAEKALYFRHHSAQAGEGGGEYAWVGSSGLIGEGEIVITPSLRRPFLAKPARSTKVDEDDDEAKGGVKKPAPSTPAPKTATPSTPAPVQKQEALVKLAYPRRPHTVRLYFSEPENRDPGARVFSVALQGKTVLENFDVVVQAGKEGGTLVREFHGVEIGSDLRVTLTAAPGSTEPPVLNGLEFIAETPGR